MFKNLIIIAICIAGISCSTKLSQYFSNDPETAKRNDQLMKSFKVDEEVISKFQEEKQTDTSIAPHKESESPKHVQDTKKPKEVKPVLPKPASKKSKTQTSVKIARAKAKANKHSFQAKTLNTKPIYPEGFPEQFKKIDKSSQKFWTNFRPIIFANEEVYMDINYMGVSTGKIAISTKGKTKIGDQEVYHLKAMLKTARYYRYLYELDDNLDSYVTTESFIPIKYSLIQRESGQNIDDLQLFDLKNFKTYTFYKRETKNKSKKYKKIKFIPKYFQDPLSVIFFLRGLKMEKNVSYDIPIINKGKLLSLKAQLVGVEALDTKIGKKTAYKVKASTTYSGDTLKSGDMLFWFSKDERKIFLKFEAKIKIGSISGDIEKYKH